MKLLFVAADKMEFPGIVAHARSVLASAQDFEDIVYDLETGAVEVRHPELLLQLSRDR